MLFERLSYDLIKSRVRTVWSKYLIEILANFPPLTLYLSPQGRGEVRGSFNQVFVLKSFNLIYI
jgi:hypothetical protein